MVANQLSAVARDPAPYMYHWAPFMCNGHPSVYLSLHAPPFHCLVPASNVGLSVSSHRRACVSLPGTIIDSKPEPPPTKPRTMSTSSGEAHALLQNDLQLLKAVNHFTGGFYRDRQK